MDLQDYLAQSGISAAAFGRTISKSRQRVSALCKGDRPSLTLAQTIHIVTNGSVSLMDWPHDPSCILVRDRNQPQQTDLSAASTQKQPLGETSQPTDGNGENGEAA